uniref:V-type proton ATPase proteolipid subunit n=1 Tax=Arcella intermedia TaxID=1963864 RepID=A0A6B2LN06_9EUKA
MLASVPISAWFFGFAGVAISMIGSTVGASYGIAKSGIGIASAGIHRPNNVVKYLIPVVMAGMIGIYGLIISVFIISNVTRDSYSAHNGFAHLASGLVIGLSSVPVGWCTGVVGDEGVRGCPRCKEEQKMFVAMVLLQVFAGACGLYALIVSLLLAVAQ